VTIPSREEKVTSQQSQQAQEATVSAPSQSGTELVWKALADPTRRAILDLLRDRPRTTGELTGEFPQFTRFAVIKHLGVLQQADLVVVRPRGRERWNYLNGVPLRQAYERWMRPFADRWAASLLRLEEAVSDRGREAGMATTGQVETAKLDVVEELTIAASREKVFGGLCAMGSWWPHRFVDGSRVHLEAVVGGRFWEEWSDGDGVLYATVTGVKRPERLECSGPMGIRSPVTGVITYELEERDGGTRVRVTHRAFGDIDEATRQSYTQGWREVLGVLASHVGAV
jgi:uncharacterized protein YndB with AHSA1/START domain/DNA-binding transcriptional ArsR family regulator